MPKRKTSTLPSRVYKYTIFSPLDHAEEVDAAFNATRPYYNSLIGIDLDRRAAFRSVRAKLFPAFVPLEAERKSLEDQLEQQRRILRAIKAASRTREVDAGVRAEVLATLAKLRDVDARLRVERDKTESAESLEILSLLRQARKDQKARSSKQTGTSKSDDPVLKALHVRLKQSRDNTPLGREANRIREDANEKIKKLRPTIYSGTYQLLEKDASAACAFPVDPDFKDEPDHLLSSRLGVHMVGGMGADKLSTSTLMRIDPIPTFKIRASGKQHARGKAARTILWFRIGSIGRGGPPLWARFPMVMDRPLPADARIKDAYITRRPFSARMPWQYSLCIALESATFERTFFTEQQKGTTSINFGWRLLPSGEIRVAMANSDVSGMSEIRLPPRFMGGFAKCRSLQETLDQIFDVARDALVRWIEERRPMLPERFLDEFSGLAKWRCQSRLAELVWYWTSHRIPGDGAIFPTMVEWKDSYRHLKDWIDHQRRKLLNWRDDFYGQCAKRLATTSAKLVVDTFRISSVAQRPNPEEQETGGQAARRNRQIAAPGKLRLAILHAAASYHSEVVAAKSVNSTRRCGICGFFHDHAIEDLVHQCENPDEAAHHLDQDVNNTINLHASHESGEVVRLVVPAKIADSGKMVSSERSSFREVRRKLG